MTAYYEKSDKWDRFFLGLAEYYSTMSKDPSTKVGAVIVDTKNRVVGMGYNGFPRGVSDTPERLNDRTWKYPLVVHAEVNAIINAGHRTEGCRIYVTPTMMWPNACPDCAKALVQAGIVECIGWQNDNIDKTRWKEMQKFTKVLFDEGGVSYRSVKR